MINSTPSISHRLPAKIARIILPIVLVAAMAMGGITPAQAAPGDLDPDFGSGGIATAAGTFHAVAIQPDGKIVAAGYVGDTSDRDLVVARYSSNGMLDTSFSDDGVVITDAGPSDGAWAVTLRPGGGIIVVGYSSFLSASSDFVVICYRNDGALDPSFDTDGIAITDMGLSTMDLAYAVAVQPDGKIVAAGYSGAGGAGGNHADAALVRYNVDGSLDTSFGTNGIVRTDDASLSNDIVGMAMQPDGKIVAAGQRFTVSPGDDGHFILYRYNNDGSLDTTFDEDGIVVTDFGADTAVVYAMSLQPDGKIIAAGPSYDNSPGAEHSIALARYNPDGSLDTTFDIDGKVLTVTGQPNPLSSVALQNDGRLIAVGDEWLLRYNANGSLDTSFSGDGIVTMGGETGNDAAIQDDGKIVVVGSVVARYLSTDSPPTPMLLAPVDGAATSDDTTFFDWGDVNGAIQYQVQIDNDADFSSPAIDTTATTSIYTPSSGLSDGTYYWHVRTEGTGGWSAYGAIWAVTIDTVPGTAITVNETADELNSDGDCSLREAVRAANTNAAVDACPAGSSSLADIITLADGAIYVLTIAGADEDAALTGDLDIVDNAANVDLIMRVTGEGTATIDTSGIAGRVLQVLGNATVEIMGVTISGGNAIYDGGGVYNEGTTTLTNCKVINSSILGTGGGLYNTGILAIQNGSTVGGTGTGNSAGGGGGIYNDTGTVILVDSTISNNTAEFGGGVYNDAGIVSLTSSTLTGNVITASGGGIFNSGP